MRKSLVIAAVAGSLALAGAGSAQANPPGGDPWSMPSNGTAQCTLLREPLIRAALTTYDTPALRFLNYPVAAAYSLICG
ncbi:hypothetical protein NDR87_01405 [Nocardia sp. CDC159]|uniref:DUF732 domain-containing protein n=1 Tax=Nocardia pulmonis TaxID=2951408 RepID=A0A9X2E6A6_9NOCA|nr:MULTISPECIES: hypothetical protein [Nocardia]MCM6772333.1 hypothetical protein [Nocardia pulmonis]MCM6785009.1 hypothetical protein [Nocardia sp. CDC159]